MLNKRYKAGITEVLVLLEQSQPEYTKKIPVKILNFFRENALNNYKPKIDSKKEIKDLELLPETRGLLSILYLNYWANPEEKEEFKGILKENQKKYDEEIRKKYDPDNIFKNEIESSVDLNKDVQVEKEEDKNEAMVGYKESFFNKIISGIKNWIKSFFS